MVSNLVYLATAINDLKGIYNFIAKDSVKYAQLEIKKIRAYAESLMYHPTKGRYYKTIKGNDIRLVNFKSYMIFYHIYDTDSIHILSIHHHARSIANNPVFKEEG
jgi:toxin ParE1/3/4